MTLAWAQRQAELLRDCIVSPGVFASMVDRLCDFVVSYQHALESECAFNHNVAENAMIWLKTQMAIIWLKNPM